jgi:hypothetical protein
LKEARKELADHTEWELANDLMSRYNTGFLEPVLGDGWEAKGPSMFLSERSKEAGEAGNYLNFINVLADSNHPQRW